MSITQEEITRTFDAMQSRSPPPKLTPEQLNAIDLLIFGKTDKEVAETIGVGRNSISKWYKNAFFVAELNARREELWKDSKLRLKSLAHEAVDVLSNGLHSSDEKTAISSAVHILKTVGLYGEVKDNFGPTMPEKVVWNQREEKELQIYMALRPDSFCEWSVKNRMEELAQADAHKYMAFWYEHAVDEQKKELREFKKRLKNKEAKLPQVELIPEPIEDDESEKNPSSGQGDRLETAEAKA
jgi:DNA-binding CsgD family transcriptional regulator